MSGHELVSLADAATARPWARSDGKDSTRWLRRLISERRIPYHKVGGRVLLDLADLDALAAAGRIAPAQALRVVRNRRIA